MREISNNQESTGVRPTCNFYRCQKSNKNRQGSASYGVYLAYFLNGRQVSTIEVLQNHSSITLMSKILVNGFAVVAELVEHFFFGQGSLLGNEIVYHK